MQHPTSNAVAPPRGLGGRTGFRLSRSHAWTRNAGAAAAAGGAGRAATAADRRNARRAGGGMAAPDSWLTWAGRTASSLVQPADRERGDLGPGQPADLGVTRAVAEEH